MVGGSVDGVVCGTVVAGVVCGGAEVVAGDVYGGVVCTVPPFDDPPATCVEPSVWMVAFVWPSTFCAVMRHCAFSGSNTARAR